MALVGEGVVQRGLQKYLFWMVTLTLRQWFHRNVEGNTNELYTTSCKHTNRTILNVYMPCFKRDLTYSLCKLQL